MNIFNEFLDRAQISEPEEEIFGDPDEEDNELNLCDPYSKISCLILYMYSCEFGAPPLYSELNRVCRTMDLEHLRTLGPFAQCLHEIADNAEFYRKEGDKMPTGEDIGGTEQNMAGLFMLWRGLQMKDEWIKDYEDNTIVGNMGPESGEYAGLPKFIHMPGNQSCSQNIYVALKFAFERPDPIDDQMMKPVLFAISCQNYFSP